uniref:GOLD domain-containing protein n=1 Tax=Strongyloides papillosus TaxID=174720 RepID=A0A0N5BFY5_STREA
MKYILYFSTLLIFYFSSLSKGVSITNVINGVEHKIGTTLEFEISSSSKMECFYETIENGNILSVALDVVNMESTNVQFRITSPSAKFSEWYKGTQYAVYDGIAEESGDYEVCVVAYVGTKPVVVALSIVSYSSAKINDANKLKESEDPTEATKMLSDRINAIGGKIVQIYANTRLANLMIKKDEKVQESNLSYLNTSTFIQTCFIIICSTTQIYAIKKLFETNPRRVRI